MTHILNIISSMSNYTPHTSWSQLPSHTIAPVRLKSVMENQMLISWCCECCLATSSRHLMVLLPAIPVGPCYFLLHDWWLARCWKGEHWRRKCREVYWEASLRQLGGRVLEASWVLLNHPWRGRHLDRSSFGSGP